MQNSEPMVDIHCHLAPDLDDGAQSWRESLAMARMAVADGIHKVVVTPHQLGVFSRNGAEQIRRRIGELRRWLAENQVSLEVHPGAEVHAEASLADKIRDGEVLTLADRGRHVLLDGTPDSLELLPTVLDALAAAGLTGVLAHPERLPALLRQPQRLKALVQRGCLLQITADSLVGANGDQPRQLAEWLLREGLVHVVATGAHGATSRRPLMRHAFIHITEATNADVARAVCCQNPGSIVDGADVVVVQPRRNSRLFGPWLKWRRAG